MTDVWFYHLTSQPLEQALPTLVERSLERGWNVAIQGRSEERIAALDALLWTYSDTSFIPHGTARDGDAGMQKVWLTTTPDNPSNAQIRFFVEGVDVAPALDTAPGAYERALILFDGNDTDQVDHARAQWRSLKDAGNSLSYWQQDENGRWSKKA